MVRRFRRAVRYRRGGRTHGWGRVGQHRKSGSRGGRGRSGRHKHKWTWVIKHAVDSSGYPFFGKHGFVQPTRVGGKAINVGELDALLDRLVAEGKARVEGGRYVVDIVGLGYSRLLGGGRVSRPIVVYAPAATRGAIRKLVGAGGEVRAVLGAAYK